MFKKWMLSLLTISAALTISGCSTLCQPVPIPMPVNMSAHQSLTPKEKSHLQAAIKTDPLVASGMKKIRHNYAGKTAYIGQLEAAIKSTH